MDESKYILEDKHYVYFVNKGFLNSEGFFSAKKFRSTSTCPTAITRMAIDSKVDHNMTLKQSQNYFQILHGRKITFTNTKSSK